MLLLAEHVRARVELDLPRCRRGGRGTRPCRGRGGPSAGRRPGGGPRSPRRRRRPSCAARTSAIGSRPGNAGGKGSSPASRRRSSFARRSARRADSCLDLRRGFVGSSTDEGIQWSAACRDARSRSGTRPSPTCRGSSRSTTPRSSAGSPPSTPSAREPGRDDAWLTERDEIHPVLVGRDATARSLAGRRSASGRRRAPTGARREVSVYVRCGCERDGGVRRPSCLRRCRAGPRHRRGARASRAGSRCRTRRASRSHESFGFRSIGTQRRCGEKLGRILDVELMDLHLD